MVISKKKLNVKPITDKNGIKGVFIPSEDWKAFKKELEKVKKTLNIKSAMKEKPSAFEDLKKAVQEMALYRAGKIKLRNINDLLSEL